MQENGFISTKLLSMSYPLHRIMYSFTSNDCIIHQTILIRVIYWVFKGKHNIYKKLSFLYELLSISTLKQFLLNCNNRWFPQLMLRIVWRKTIVFNCFNTLHTLINGSSASSVNISIFSSFHFIWGKRLKITILKIPVCGFIGYVRRILALCMSGICIKFSISSFPISAGIVARV